MADPLAATQVGTVGAAPPSLTMTAVVDALGIPPSPNDEGFANQAGMVHMFAGDYAPYGLPVADGRTLPAAAYPRLNAVMKGAFGGGGDATSFTLPDLRGRAAIGTSQAAPIGTATPQTLAMTYMVAINGTYPAGNSSPFISMVVPFTGRELPGAWLPADGRLLAIPDHPWLFGLLGTNFGGDGRTNFALPDLRARAPVGIGMLPDSSYVGLGMQVGDLGLGLNYFVCTVGMFPARNAGGDFLANEVTAGEVVALASQPRMLIDNGFLPADGRLLQIAEYSFLNDVFGNLYGGDGITTFALPDLRGRMIVGPTPKLGRAVQPPNTRSKTVSTNLR